MTKKQKIQDLKDQMKLIEQYSDIEIRHQVADKILCDLLILEGHSDIVDVFDSINKWYA